MPAPRVYAGQAITADRWNSLVPQIVTQENDQIITSSDTPIASEITFVPEPNAEYAYWLYIAYSATTNADLIWEWDAPGALLASFTQGYAATAGSGVNTGSGVVMRRPANTTNRIAGGTDTTSPPVNFHSAYDSGTFSTDGTTQAVTMMFAQGTVHADQTILRGGNQTRMLYQRIR